MNLEHMRDPATKSQLAAAYIAPYDHGEVVDAYTFRAHLREPYQPFLDVLAQSWLAMESPKAITENPKGLGDHPVGSGPYIVESYTRQQSIHLVRRKDWSSLGARLHPARRSGAYRADHHRCRAGSTDPLQCAKQRPVRPSVRGAAAGRRRHSQRSEPGARRSNAHRGGLPRHHLQHRGRALRRRASPQGFHRGGQPRRHRPQYRLRRDRAEVGLYVRQYALLRSVFPERADLRRRSGQPPVGRSRLDRARRSGISHPQRPPARGDGADLGCRKQHSDRRCGPVGRPEDRL